MIVEEDGLLEDDLPDVMYGGFVNGGFLNGGFLNGGFLNGGFLNGGFLNGSTVDGLTLSNGVELDDVHVYRNRIRGRAPHKMTIGAKTYLKGDLIAAGKFDGAVFYGTSSDGDLIEVTIDDAFYSNGLWRYDISTRRQVVLQTRFGNVYSWAPSVAYCPDSDAVAVAGEWDYRQGVSGGGRKIYSGNDRVTLACSGVGAIAKCLEIGYKEWQDDARHQACVRAVRADFCGDGKSRTLDGTFIDLWDRDGIFANGSASYWFEAKWSKDGATCISEARNDELYGFWGGGDYCSDVPTTMDFQVTSLSQVESLTNGCGSSSGWDIITESHTAPEPCTGPKCGEGVIPPSY